MIVFESVFGFSLYDYISDESSESFDDSDTSDESVYMDFDCELSDSEYMVC